MNPPKRVIVDEGVGRNDEALWQRACPELRGADLVWVAQVHPGIPDDEIVQHLLDPETAVVTKDRRFHNGLVDAKYRSYCLLNGRVLTDRIKGIPSRSFIVQKSSELKSTYHRAQADLRALVLPQNEQKLKKLRTRQRRIRSYAAGLDNVREVAVSISRLDGKATPLIGALINVIPYAIPKLLGSETYVRETGYRARIHLAAICHVLVELLRLQLHEKPVRLYLDGLCFSAEDLEAELGAVHDDFGAFYLELQKQFLDIAWSFPEKGANIELLRRKMNAVVRNPRDNQAVASEIDEFVQRFASREYR